MSNNAPHLDDIKRSKTCSRCGVFGEHYYSHYANDLMDSYCVECRKKKQKNDRTRVKNSVRDRVVRKFGHRTWILSSKYRLTRDVYDSIVKTQEGRCAICSVVFDLSDEPGTKEEKARRPHVDHDHQTGMIRGLLCTRCNVGIGMLGDDPDRMLVAVKYVNKARRLAKRLEKKGGLELFKVRASIFDRMTSPRKVGRTRKPPIGVKSP